MLVKLFVSDCEEADYFQDRVNSWLAKHPDIHIVKVSQSIIKRDKAGDEDNDWGGNELIIVIFYEDNCKCPNPTQTENGSITNFLLKNECPRFIQFLKEITQTPEDIKLIQEFFGYSLLNQNIFSKFLVLLGSGANGKSTLVNVLREMLGFDNCTSLSLSELNDNFLLASLVDKKANFSSEMNSNACDGSLFKMILAGDSIKASIKYKNPFTFNPSCKFIFELNHLPEVVKNSDSIQRLALIVILKRQFHESERDPYLQKKLLKEMPGISNWAIEGLNRLMTNKKFTKG